MVRFFILDLDGCVTYPFKTPDWGAITAIRQLQLESKDNEMIPALSLCTGRPQPYAEAVAQWLGIRHTIIFESGGGFYHPVTNELAWSPSFTKEIKEKSDEIRAWLLSDVIPKYPGMMPEFTKHTDVGLVHTDIREIKEVYEAASMKIRESFPEFEVHYTDVSVNIIVSACNKQSGLHYFAEKYGATNEEIAYIGDTSGDIKALKWAGFPFSPSNAIDEVKSVSKVMKGEATVGVLEAYRLLVEKNTTLPT